MKRTKSVEWTEKMVVDLLDLRDMGWPLDDIVKKIKTAHKVKITKNMVCSKIRELKHGGYLDDDQL